MVWGDELSEVTWTWNGGSTYKDVVANAGDLIVVAAVLVNADAPMSEIKTDETGVGDQAFSLLAYPGTNYELTYGYRTLTNTGTHRITLTPTDTVSMYNAEAKIWEIDQDSTDTIYDVTTGMKNNEISGTHSSHDSTSITASDSPALVFAFFDGPVSSPVADTDFDTSSVTQGTAFAREYQASATAITATTTFTNFNGYTNASLIAFIQDGGGGGGGLSIPIAAYHYRHHMGT